MKIHELIPDTFNGVVSITKNDTVIFQESFGYADLANSIPNELDTRFPTASAGKVFVATAILQLVHKEKISFESTLGEILSFDLHQINPNVTVRQLLNHTSGIPDYCDERVITDYAELWKDYPNYKIRTSSDLLPLFIKKPMMYPLGEKFQYNNSGYVMLGLIIEAIENIPFDQYLYDHIFNPSGMIGTGYYELDRLPPKCANAYIFEKELKNNAILFGSRIHFYMDQTFSIANPETAYETIRLRLLEFNKDSIIGSEDIPII